MTIHDTVSRHRQRLFLPADHAVFPGHFPDAPVVPAVLVLSEVLEVAERWLGAAVHPIRLRQAKFPAPWLPGMTVEATLEREGQQLRFQVTADQQTLAVGLFDLPAAQNPGELR